MDMVSFFTHLPNYVASLLAGVDVTHSHVAMYLGVAYRSAQAHEKHLILVFGPLDNIVPHHKSITYKT
jgi:hypothetical protein